MLGTFFCQNDLNARSACRQALADTLHNPQFVSDTRRRLNGFRSLDRRNCVTDTHSLVASSHIFCVGLMVISAKGLS